MGGFVPCLDKFLVLTNDYSKFPMIEGNATPILSTFVRTLPQSIWEAHIE